MGRIRLVDPVRGPRRTLKLATDDAQVTIGPDDGGRIASVVIHGHEVLVTDGAGTLDRGCFPMAPFAGRIRDGRFSFAGRDWQLAQNDGSHAIHGTVAARRWRVEDERTISIDLGLGWPFRGRLVQRFELVPGCLRVQLELSAEEPMPATIGWHPWFRWQLDAGPASLAAPRAELDLEPTAMYERGPDGITLASLAAPRPGPWDDCFTGLARSPVVRWPGALEVRLDSSCPDWVVFTQSPRGLCVEPQTGPPDAPNIAPRIVVPGTPLRADMSWTWGAAGGRPSTTPVT